MVVKPRKSCAKRGIKFEYGVILNGSQTAETVIPAIEAFEYGVILNGSQTSVAITENGTQFEYGVILNGSQTSYLCRNAG